MQSPRASGTKRLEMADKSLGEPQEWVVTGMDCASCAVKIRTAVERLPGVSDVNVAVMAEKLTLRLEPGTTPRDKIEAAVVKLGFGIGATKAAKAKAFVLPGAMVEKPAHDDYDDHAGHDHPEAKANVRIADEGHGAPGHLHDYGFRPARAVW
jgi:Zn2+/Cd2+-exporting ATPase